MIRIVVLLTAVALVTGSVDRQRLNDDHGYPGDDAEAGAQQGAIWAVPAARQGAESRADTESTRSGDDAAPVGSSEGGRDQRATISVAQATEADPLDGDAAEEKVERTQLGPNIGTGAEGEYINPGTGITIARPGQVGPIPGCYINDSGYTCCNNELEKILLGAQEELNKLDPGKSDCNTLRQAKHIQNRAQTYFGTDFETIVALDDFAFRSNFLGNMTCKVKIGGKYLLAYATPDETKVDKFPIYEPTTPSPYFPPPPPLRTGYGEPAPPPPSNYGPPFITAPVGASEEGETQQETTNAAGPSDDENEEEQKMERTQWAPNVGTSAQGEYINTGTGITIARPGQVGPIPGCYINDSGYTCCNNELEKILLGAQEELNKLDPGKSDCNTLRQAKHIQNRAQTYFGTDFETIVALDDFAFRSNFLGNMTCKVKVDGKYLLAYATPDETKVDKFSIYEPTTPSPYFPPPPPLRTGYGEPAPPAPSPNYEQPPQPPHPSQPYSQRRNRWSK